MGDKVKAAKKGQKKKKVEEPKPEEKKKEEAKPEEKKEAPKEGEEVKVKKTKEKKSQKDRPKSKKKHAKVQIWTLYDNGKAKNEACPRCGPGTFIASFENRKYCGKCGWSEISKTDIKKEAPQEKKEVPKKV